MQTEPGPISVRLPDGSNFLATPETPAEEYMSKLGKRELDELKSHFRDLGEGVVGEALRKYFTPEDLELITSMSITPLDQSEEQKKQRDEKIKRLNSRFVALQYYLLLSHRSNRGEYVVIEKIK